MFFPVGCGTAAPKSQAEFYITYSLTSRPTHANAPANSLNVPIDCVHLCCTCGVLRIAAFGIGNLPLDGVQHSLQSVPP